MTDRPNGPWFDSLPNCESHLLPCGQGRHIVQAGRPWAPGWLSHPDAEAELVLAALGGEKTRCLEVAQAWGRHVEDLSVLAIGPRGPADEIAVSWSDVDQDAQAAQRIGCARPSPPLARRARRAGAEADGRPARSPRWARPRARHQQGMQDRERAARLRNDMLSLLALGYGFQVRLIGQVAEAHADRPIGAMDEDQVLAWSPAIARPGWPRWPEQCSSWASTPTRSWPRRCTAGPDGDRPS